MKFRIALTTLALALFAGSVVSPALAGARVDISNLGEDENWEKFCGGSPEFPLVSSSSSDGYTDLNGFMRETAGKVLYTPEEIVGFGVPASLISRELRCAYIDEGSIRVKSLAFFDIKDSNGLFIKGKVYIYFDTETNEKTAKFILNEMSGAVPNS